MHGDYRLDSIPGPDPGACLDCGGWRKAGMTHNCADFYGPDYYRDEYLMSLWLALDEPEAAQGDG